MTEDHTPQDEKRHDDITVPPQVLYGVSLFQMEDDHPVVHVTGDPDMGQLQRLLAAALANLQADIVAQKVVQRLEHERTKTKIHIPGRD